MASNDRYDTVPPAGTVTLSYRKEILSRLGDGWLVTASTRSWTVRDEAASRLCARTGSLSVSPLSEVVNQETGALRVLPTKATPAPAELSSTFVSSSEPRST